MNEARQSDLGSGERSVSGAPVAKRRRARTPVRAALEGEVVRLEPLEPARHATDLFRAGHDAGAAQKLWTHLPYGPFEDHRRFEEWLRACAAFDDPLFFAVLPKSADRASGMASYLHIQPGDGVLEVGHVWFAPRSAADPGLDRDTLPADPRSVRRARLPPCRVEVRRAQRRLASRRAAARLPLRASSTDT